MRVVLQSVAILSVIVVSACGSSDMANTLMGESNSPSSDVGSSNTSTSSQSFAGAFAPEILDELNEIRTSGINCGGEYMPPVRMLEFSDILAQVAIDHANDMAVNKFFSHTGSDGSNAADRLRRINYQWSLCGENLAFNFNTKASVLAGWLRSADHCKNMMNGNFIEVGVSYAENKQHVKYWTMLLAAH